MKRDVAGVGDQINAELIAFLLGKSADEQLLASGESAVDAGLVRYRVVFSSPVDVLQVDAAIDVQMVDSVQRLSIFELRDFFQVGENVEFIVVASNAQIYWFAFFEWIFLFLLLSPFCQLSCRSTERVSLFGGR